MLFKPLVSHVELRHYSKDGKLHGQLDGKATDSVLLPSMKGTDALARMLKAREGARSMEEREREVTFAGEEALAVERALVRDGLRDVRAAEQAPDLDQVGTLRRDGQTWVTYTHVQEQMSNALDDRSTVRCAHLIGQNPARAPYTVARADEEVQVEHIILTPRVESTCSCFNSLKAHPSFQAVGFKAPTHTPTPRLPRAKRTLRVPSRATRTAASAGSASWSSAKARACSVQTAARSSPSARRARTPSDLARWGPARA